ncbi:glycoside hydrolase family 65 protein [Mycoplasma mycoides]|uniref:glycoside hydrolase family 65 protein n=1 Tax=Mycoplasma mycoides TaxID=2102 RepID=UPI002240D7C9|nr:glycoside hydrolase family 65 protein [Mycoplasma mycoides]QVK08689.1 glycoside hydrolase family 65 protein [Mycoplasma mycoides subsp. capri]
MKTNIDVNIKRLFEVDPWKLVENKLPDNGYDFRLSESITSLGNEYLGMRGNFEETYTGDTHKGCYVGGLWYPDKTIVGWWKNGYPNYFGKVINAVNLLGLNVVIDNIELDLFKQTPSSYKRTLDLKQGILSREFATNINNKEIKVETERFVSIDTKELVAIKYSITSNKDISLDLTSYINGDVINRDSNYKTKFWTHLDSLANDHSQLVESKMIENNFDIQRFSYACYATNSYNLKTKDIVFDQSNLYAKTTYKFDLKQNQTLIFYKLVTLVHSLNYSEDKLKENAIKINNQINQFDYEQLKEKHTSLWEKRWLTSDVKIIGSDLDQQAIRFNLFQLFCTYYGNDDRLNIGPKGFTGEKYGGATYWDTEAYCLPLYLKTSDPKISRNLLKYRHNHLTKAIENAKLLGFKGALYPMVTFNGVECHNEWEITFEEIHRNAAMVYAIYNYTNYTGDFDYIKEFGMDVMVEVSRFWADRVHYHSIKDKYFIHGVTGPNEYENNVNNNWLTNLMCQWVLSYTLEMLDKLNLDKSKWNLSTDETNKWVDIINKIYLPYDKDLDIFVQHDTFLDKDLKHKDLLSKDERPLNKNWSWDRILRSVYIKQADVLQGIYYLWDKFSKEQITKNFKFYEQFTVHESSLSPCVHSIIAARIDLMDKAYEFYNRTARLDLDNYNNDTDDGLHITSMTGSYLAIVEGFGGMLVRNDIPCFSPKLPKQWNGYEFNINFRDRVLKVKHHKTEVEIQLIKGQSLRINLFDKEYLLESNIKIEV